MPIEPDTFYFLSMPLFALIKISTMPLGFLLGSSLFSIIVNVYKIVFDWPVHQSWVYSIFIYVLLFGVWLIFKVE